MSKQTKAKRKILKILKKSKRQFYDESGNKITPEHYLDLLLQQKAKDLTDFLNKLKRNRKWKP